MRKLSLIFILISTVLVSACGISETKPFRKTSDFYYEHINTPAELKMKKSKITDPGQALIAQMMPIDAMLNQFSRDFVGFTYVPSPSEVQNFARTYPWLSSVALLNAEGGIIGEEVNEYFSGINYAPIVEKESKLGARKMFATILDSDSFPLISCAMPLYNSGTIIGYLVANFSASALAYASPDSGNLIISYEDRLLWSNQADFVTSTAYLKNSATNLNGSLKQDNKSIQWQSFYIADLPLVVANIYTE